jgi:hypothetical protein
MTQAELGQATGRVVVVSYHPDSGLYIVSCSECVVQHHNRADAIKKLSELLKKREEH